MKKLKKLLSVIVILMMLACTCKIYTNISLADASSKLITVEYQTYGYCKYYDVYSTGSVNLKKDWSSNILSGEGTKIKDQYGRTLVFSVARYLEARSYTSKAYNSGWVSENSYNSRYSKYTYSNSNVNGYNYFMNIDGCGYTFRNDGKIYTATGVGSGNSSGSSNSGNSSNSGTSTNSESTSNSAGSQNQNTPTAPQVVAKDANSVYGTVPTMDDECKKLYIKYLYKASVGSEPDESYINSMISKDVYTIANEIIFSGSATKSNSLGTRAYVEFLYNNILRRNGNYNYSSEIQPRETRIQNGYETKRYHLKELIVSDEFKVSVIPKYQAEVKSGTPKTVAKVGRNENDVDDNKIVQLTDDEKQLFVEQLTKICCNREASSEEQEKYKSKNAYQIAKEIVFGEETQKIKNVKEMTNEEYINFIYNAVLNRNVENNNNRAIAITNGDSREYHLKELVCSEEFKVNVVSKLYKNEITRREEAKKEETQKQQERESRRSKISYISDEVFKRYINNLYKNIVKVDMPEDKLNATLNHYQDGYDIEECIQDVLELEEIQSIINDTSKMTSKNFVITAYESILYITPNYYRESESSRLEDTNHNKVQWCYSRLISSVEFASIKQKLIDNSFDFAVKQQDEEVVEISAVTKGDLNNDGAIDGSDATILLKVLSTNSYLPEGTYDSYIEYMDVDGDGSVSTVDVKVILKYYAYASSGMKKSLEEITQIVNEES